VIWACSSLTQNTGTYQVHWRRMFHRRTTSLTRFRDANVTMEMTVCRPRIDRCVGFRARRCTCRTDEIDRCAIHDRSLLRNKPANTYVPTFAIERYAYKLSSMLAASSMTIDSQAWSLCVIIRSSILLQRDRAAYCLKLY